MIRSVLWLVFLLLALPAYAQDAAPPASPAPINSAPPLLMLQQYTPTHPERILLTFYKLVGKEPNFMVWARKSPYLSSAKAVDRDPIISREQNRMLREWSEFDPNDPLIIHTKVHLNDYSTIQEVLQVNEFNPRTFFNFSLYGENIAVVPNGITDFSKIPISKTQMNDILNRTGGGTVTAELLLKPKFGDAKSPFVQGGVSYWLLSADIGEIRFWTSNTADAQLLWMHRADWYKPKTDTSLMNLKSAQ